MKNNKNVEVNNVYLKIETTNYNQLSGKGYNLKPNEEKSVLAKWQYDSAGTYTVKIIVDPNHNIAETDENNNIFTKQIKVS